MTKLVIVMAIVASMCFVEAVPVPNYIDPLNFVAKAVGFDFKKMIDDAASIADNIKFDDSAIGNSVGSIVTSKKETVIENGVPVEKLVTKYIVNRDGNVFSGIL